MYNGKLLGPVENLSQFTKELMAIVMVMRKKKIFFLRRHFTIWTDQRSLKYIKEQRKVGMGNQRWVSKLIGFDFEIKFKRGLQQGRDALSRLQAANPEFGALVSTTTMNWENLKEEIEDDSFNTAIKVHLEEHGTTRDW